MGLAHGPRQEFVSRRRALAPLGAVAAARDAGAAETGIMQPLTLDHVNIRVSNTARTGAFYMRLFDTPVLRSAALRAQPASPPSEGFFLEFEAAPGVLRIADPDGIRIELAAAN